VREAGYPKPRIEGEDNGEWIIVDCGSAVAHIMQPTIRSYYNLEEIWGDKPVRLKLGAPKPAEPVRKPVAKKKANVSAGRTPTRRDSVPVGPMGSEALKPTRKAPAKSAGKPAAKAAGKTAGTTTGKTASKTASKAPKSSAKMVTKTAAKPAVKSSAKAKPKA
jgi:ribosome-associated protein